MQRGQLLPSAHHQRKRLPGAAFHQLRQLLFGGDFFAVDGKDNVPLLDTGGLCRTDRAAVAVGDSAGTDHHHAVGDHLDAKGCSAQGNHPTVDHLHTDRLNVDESQQL